MSSFSDQIQAYSENLSSLIDQGEALKHFHEAVNQQVQQLGDCAQGLGYFLNCLGGDKSSTFSRNAGDEASEKDRSLPVHTNINVYVNPYPAADARSAATAKCGSTCPASARARTAAAMPSRPGQKSTRGDRSTNSPSHCGKRASHWLWTHPAGDSSLKKRCQPNAREQPSNANPEISPENQNATEEPTPSQQLQPDGPAPSQQSQSGGPSNDPQQCGRGFQGAWPASGMCGHCGRPLYAPIPEGVQESSKPSWNDPFAAAAAACEMAAYATSLAALG